MSISFVKNYAQLEEEDLIWKPDVENNCITVRKMLRGYCGGVRVKQRSLMS
ncbi:hypothetical protein WN51_05286 [Melipona quadrifasciata]|uniref:Uncharacterized protein n=1 Tax=Melipona quadrifasciata TaxID=166423 RepID=A0A0M9AC80_9HYME|nr:hypothetical protein WN51_05286 [Melipona quadrifasciata]